MNKRELLRTLRKPIRDVELQSGTDQIRGRYQDLRSILFEDGTRLLLSVMELDDNYAITPTMLPSKGAR